MAKEIQLSAAVRENLLALQGTQSLIAQTQNRLSTGLKVASPIDDPRVFFEAKSLNDHGRDVGEKKEGVDQSISSVQTALSAIEGVDSLVQQMKGLTISARTATGNELAAIVAQFNELRNQINNLTSDAKYQGVNLINGTGTQLNVEFSTDTTSLLTISSVDLRVGSLGLNISSALSFSLASVLDASLAQITSAIGTLRGQAQSLASNVAILKTRLDFNSVYVNLHEEGAGKLNLANVTEEGAKLVALQTRQQLGINALAFAGQAEQSILTLFR
jgi:flagellin